MKSALRSALDINMATVKVAVESKLAQNLAYDSRNDTLQADALIRPRHSAQAASTSTTPRHYILQGVILVLLLIITL